MSVSTVLCEVVTRDGLAAWFDPWTRQLTRHEFTGPDSFGDWQPGRIPVEIGHRGPTIGCVDYLETGYGYGNDALMAVAVVQGVPAEMIDGQVMCSPEIRSNSAAGGGHATRSTVEYLALVDETAGVTSTRVRAWPGDYRDPLSFCWDRTSPAILRRATEAADWSLRYRRPERTRIHRPRQEMEPERRHSGERHEMSYSATTFGGVISVREPLPT